VDDVRGREQVSINITYHEKRRDWKGGRREGFEDSSSRGKKKARCSLGILRKRLVEVNAPKESARVKSLLKRAGDAGKKVRVPGHAEQHQKKGGKDSDARVIPLLPGGIWEK